MELTELRDKIKESFSGSKEDLDAVIAMIEQDRAIFPFNQYEHLICTGGDWAVMRPLITRFYPDVTFCRISR